MYKMAAGTLECGILSSAFGGCAVVGRRLGKLGVWAGCVSWSHTGSVRDERAKCRKLSSSSCFRGIKAVFGSYADNKEQGLGEAGQEERERFATIGQCC